MKMQPRLGAGIGDEAYRAYILIATNQAEVVEFVLNGIKVTLSKETRNDSKDYAGD